MIHHTCTAPRCTSEVTRYGSLCRTHRRAKGRHGHPLQTAVLVREVSPFLACVRARRKANPSNPSWGLLEGRWRALVGDARSIVADWEAGRAVTRPHRKGAQLVLQVAEHATAQEVYEAALAVFMLQHYNAGRFRSDTAADFQAARRVRSLVPSAVGSWWDAKEQRVRKVYRDAPPGSLETLGAWLRMAFAGPAAQLVDLEVRQRVDHAAVERQRLADALEALK